MVGLNHVLLISDSANEAFAFEKILRKKGLLVTRISDNIDVAFEAVKKIRPELIIFIVPVYWTTVRDFLVSIRKIREFKRTPIVYLTSIMEGADQVFLDRYGVHTFTLGPVPRYEIVRFILKLLHIK